MSTVSFNGLLIISPIAVAAPPARPSVDCEKRVVQDPPAYGHPGPRWSAVNTRSQTFLNKAVVAAG
jgi:hypothetical protein